MRTRSRPERLRGRVEFSPGFWVAAAGLWLWEPTLVLPGALAAAVHEAGHILALKGMGRGPSKLKLTPLGAELTPGGALSYPQEMIAAAAGPAFSLIFALIWAKTRHFLLAGMSLSLGVCNLLPLYPLDGGRMAAGLCGQLLPPLWAGRVTRALGLVTALGAAVGSGWLFFRWGGLMPLLLAGWLLWHGLKKDPA